MTIDDLTKDFKNIKELRAYCNSQFLLINELNKRINELQEENKHLQELLKDNTPLIEEHNKKLELYHHVTDEMSVCIMQIKLLKDKSVSSELTYEDARKLDIYTKLLISLRKGEEGEKNPAASLSDEEFNKLLILENEIVKPNGE